MKVRRIASELVTNPNDLVNSLIEAGIEAMEREDASFKTDFVRSYHRKFTAQKIEGIKKERAAARALFPEQFQDNHEEESPDFLLRATIINHSQSVIAGLTQRMPIDEGLQFALKRRDLGVGYLSALERIYLDPAYAEWCGYHPLWEAQVRKAVADAVTAAWPARPPEVSSGERLKMILAQLPALSFEHLESLFDAVSNEQDQRLKNC